MCKIKYMYAWSICRATLQFSRTLDVCPEIKKLSVVVIEKFEGAVWLKKNHRGVYKITEQRGPYSVLLLKARILGPSHGDRSKLHNSIQSIRASQWTALNWSCNWVQDMFTLHFRIVFKLSNTSTEWLSHQAPKTWGNWTSAVVQSDWLLGVNWMMTVWSIVNTIVSSTNIVNYMTHDYDSCMLITDVSARILTLN